MSGWVKIVGIGPGDESLITPDVNNAIAAATDVVGYIPYVKRIAPRDGLNLHASDNRQELERAEFALQMAAEGKKVLVVSSGDPGVFAMASAVFEAMDQGEPLWRELNVSVLPGITAMLAASARAGAPLAHDFCCINLSDNLKPWAVIEERVGCAVSGDFAMAFYNPRSKSRPEGFARILDLLGERCEPQRLIVFARNVSLPDESIVVTRLQEATADMADMRTLVIVGSSQTRKIERNDGEFVYTPRFLKS